jgi:bifunctional enzyme CysN/CysC/sulfate adenylyltransferase subunit 1
MDLIDYSEEAFNEIKREMNEFLHSLNVYPLKYIPVSAFFGENMTLSSAKMPWYKGEPVLKAIDLFEKDKGLEHKPLRFPIQDVYKFDNRRIIAGRIEAGTLKTGDEILISPSNKVTRVKSIEYWAERDKTDSVSAGMSVGITVEDEFFNQRGEFIVHTDGAPLIADTFKANLFWMGRKPLGKAQEYKLKLATQEMECIIHSISKVIDATTLETIENASQVNINDVAEVIIKTKKKICFDEFKNNQNTGRFVILDGYDVCGGGIVSGLVQEIQTVSRFIKNDLVMALDCFDEYYYVLAEHSMKKLAVRANTFVVGDVIPVAGVTYAYPPDFDVIAIQQKIVAKIRHFKLQDIVVLHQYNYNAVPLIDVTGSFIRVASNADFVKFRDELAAMTGLESTKLVGFANKWLDFMKFREVKYLSAVKSFETEYFI